MTINYRTAIAIAVLFGASASASAQFQPVAPGTAGQPGRPTPQAQASQYQLVDPNEAGWVLNAEQGSCLAQKGRDRDYRFQMTSRGRMLLSAPNLGDPLFQEGQSAQLQLTWSDGVVEMVNAAQLRLPGGGSKNLLPRQVYVVSLDTTSLAGRFPDGFTLTADRGGRQVYAFDGSDAGPYLTTYNECAKTVFARSQRPAPVTTP